MLVHSLEDRYIESIGHAFGYYDYGEEKGLASAFKDRGRTAVYICGFARAMKQGGASLRDQYDKRKAPYIFVGMLCVPEAYQHQGYMRKLLGCI